MASSNKGEDPESVRKMVKMILSEDGFATKQAELLTVLQQNRRSCCYFAALRSAILS